MYVLRCIAALPFAVIMTLALFLLMAAMIRQPIVEWAPPKPFEKIVVTAKPRPESDPLVAPPKPVEEKMPETIIRNALPGEKPGVPFELPKPQPGGGTEIDITGPVGGVVIQVRPAYPERCRARGAQGSILVQFDVAPDGSVINPVILESTDSCFDRTVLKTMSGWKYAPAVRNGVPVVRYGLVERFSFQLEDE
jgi:protein TonB